MGKKNTPRCKFCSSAQIYFRVKTEDFQCQKCGRTFTELNDDGVSDGTGTKA